MRLRVLLLSLLTASSASVLAAPPDAPEPCASGYLSASVFANILDVTLTRSELSLLNGSEDPKLRRLMESRLRSAASHARQAIEQGAAPQTNPAITTPNLVNGLDRAIAFVTEHPLSPDTSSTATQSSPLEDLQAIRAWLIAQQAAGGH